MQEELYNRVIEYYDSQNWKYNSEEDEDGDNNIRMAMSVAEIDSVRVRTIVKENTIATYTYFPMDVPENKRLLVSEFLTRANYGLKTGNFEMDLNDGEVRYKVHSTWEDDVIPSMAMVERYIDMGFMMMNRYGGALMKVLYADMSPEDAISLAESD